MYPSNMERTRKRGRRKITVTVVLSVGLCANSKYITIFSITHPPPPNRSKYKLKNTNFPFSLKKKLAYLFPKSLAQRYCK